MLLYSASHQLDAIRFIHLCSQFVQFSSVLQSCPSVCNDMDCSMLGFPFHHQLPEINQPHVHRVGGAIQPSHPLPSPLILPSIFPYIRVFSSESVLPNRWANNWSFSFSISPSSEYSGLISFRMDWFDLIAVQVTLKSILQREELRWPRNWMGRPLSPPQIHQKIIWMLSKLHKTTSDL